MAVAVSRADRERVYVFEDVAVTDPAPERVRVAVAVSVPRADRVRVSVFEDVAVTEKARERVAVVVGLRDAAA